MAFNSHSRHLPRSVLVRAFEALGSCDLAMGPTHDGSYYPAGAKALYPGLFAASAMGTASALEILLNRAQRFGLSVRSTDEFYDIDMPADLSRLAEELRQAPERAPRTAQWPAERERTVSMSNGRNR